MFDKNVAPEGKASQLRKFSSHWSYPLTQAGILSAPRPTWFFNYLKTVLVFSAEPEPVSFTKLARGLLHLVDDGGVVVGDVEGDGAGGEEDEGLEQSLCLQKYLASPLILFHFFIRVLVAYDNQHMYPLNSANLYSLKFWPHPMMRSNFIGKQDNNNLQGNYG